MAEMRLMWIDVSPCVRGIRSLTSAMTVGANREAVRVQSTVVPRLTKPCSSGGETCIRTTSSGIAPLSNRPSISLRKMGV